MLTLSLPFGDEPELMNQSLWYKKLTVDNVRPKLSNNIPLSLRNILDLAWHSDPQMRPSADDIYEVFDASLPSNPSETL